MIQTDTMKNSHVEIILITHSEFKDYHTDFA